MLPSLRVTLIDAAACPPGTVDGAERFTLGGGGAVSSICTVIDFSVWFPSESIAPNRTVVVCVNVGSPWPGSVEAVELVSGSLPSSVYFWTAIPPLSTICHRTKIEPSEGANHVSQ